MSVGRHTIYNLAGSIAPMFISIVTVPIYLHLIGTAAYGLLAIVWMFLGYFGVFDGGLSRATAYNIAKLRDAPRLERQQVFWTAATVNLGMGIVGGTVLYLVARPVLGHLFKMPADLRASVMSALPWMAAAVPVATLVGIFNGTLEGLRKFALTNTIGVCATLAFQLIPLAIAYVDGRNVTLIIAATILVRLATAMVVFGFANHFCQAGWPRLASLTVARQLFSYGTWISVSNFLVPFFTTLDKFVIGSYLGVDSVTIYTIPDNLTRRLSIIPNALTRSLFPKISAESDAARKATFDKSFRLLLAVMAPVAVAGTLGLPLFLRLWIGARLGDQAAPIAVILLLSIFLNSMAYLPYMFLQATGRPNRNAQFHLIEIIPHVILLFLGIHYFKLQGVAFAMLILNTFDMLLLYWAAGLPIWRNRHFHVALLFIGGALAVHFTFPSSRWQSYFPYAAVILACALYFLRNIAGRNLSLKTLTAGLSRATQ